MFHQHLYIIAIHDDLHLKPYKFHSWHKLEEPDYQKRVNFAEWFLKLHPQTKNYMICSEKAYFYLTLPLNKQNNRQWSESDPMVGLEKPLHDLKFSFGVRFPQIENFQERCKLIISAGGGHIEIK